MALFHSPHANLQVICSKTRIKFHPVTGDEIDRTPGIWANFGKLGPQYSYENPLTGEVGTGAEISGHYYDTDVEAAQNGWDQDTKDMVERKLRALAVREPARIQEEVREIVRAARPWPTYDSLDAAQVLELAPALGLEAEALAYERENRGRPTVIDGLTAEAPAEPVEDEDEEPEPAARSGEEVGAPLLKTITV